MPAIGYGTFPHQGEDSAQIVEYAISIGYRLFDTALSYGNERGVGEGIRRSSVPRDEIIVTSKLPGRYHGLTEARTSVSERDHGPDFRSGARTDLGQHPDEYKEF